MIVDLARRQILIDSAYSSNCGWYLLETKGPEFVEVRQVSPSSARIQPNSAGQLWSKSRAGYVAWCSSPQRARAPRKRATFEALTRATRSRPELLYAGGDKLGHREAYESSLGALAGWSSSRLVG